MRPSHKRILLALLAAFGAATAAAKWEVLPVKGNSDPIEIDKARISRLPDGRAIVWSRLAFERDIVDEYGMRYTAIEALGRYDCENRSFATLKRVYRRDHQKVREELVERPQELPVAAGSVDDRLLTEACKPRTVGDAKKVVEAIAKLAPMKPAEAKGQVMFADMRSAEGNGKAKTYQVADMAPTGKSGDKPRFIELPKIDKSQLEDPSKGAAPTAPPSPPPAATAPANGKPAEPKPAAAARPLPVERAPEPRPVASRQELERMYATSGPRKVAPKKKEEPVPQYHNVHWDYEGEGAPGNWGKIKPEYATCGMGRRQSPIDIREGIKVDLEPIKFDYKPTQFRITDNGHTIQVDVGEGNSIKVMEREFQLVQFHFHRPAEERVNGRAFDMVVHLVHKDDDGKLAVIAVLLKKGSEHPLIQALWNNMPLERGQSIEPATIINMNAILPESRAYYTYMGSLTTPPCTEDVLWMVFKQPVEISQQQVSIFSRLYPNNARPIQPTNGRLIKETR